VFVYSLSGLDLSGATGAAQVEIEDNETTARTAVYQTFARMLMAAGDEEWAITADGGWSKELATAGALLEYSWEIDDQPVPADRAAWRRGDGARRAHGLGRLRRRRPARPRRGGCASTSTTA